MPLYSGMAPGLATLCLFASFPVPEMCRRRNCYCSGHQYCATYGRLVPRARESRHFPLSLIIIRLIIIRLGAGVCGGSFRARCWGTGLCSNRYQTRLSRTKTGPTRLTAPLRNFQFIIFPIRTDLHLKFNAKFGGVQGSEPTPGELGDSAGLVPIRNEDVPIGIEETAMGCAEGGGFDVVGIELVLRPLRLQGIVA